MTDHGVMPATTRTYGLPGLVGALTAGAGLVHAAAAGTHEGERELAVVFAVAAVVQVTLGLAIFTRPRRAFLGATVAVNLAAVAVWTASRLAGLPVIESLSVRQPVGLQDLTATVMEVIGAVAALLALRYRDAPDASRTLSPALALALVPALVGITAPHTHPEGAHHDEAGGSRLAHDPIFSGADTSRADDDELEAAKALIVTTRESLLRSFPDEAAVVAAGYRSIGDGRSPGTYEHFVHADYLTDGRELDPGRIESIVLENTGAGKRVASAMYILEWGKTMADVPDIAGGLTAWHDHQNLCWADAGIRLAGVLVNGRCFPGGTFRATPPMLHVWLQEHRCGPFAGIEGHGAATCGPHHTD
jgi:hypothetical protein